MSASRGTVPPAGKDRRAWIRFQLQSTPKPDGGRYTQADVAREAFAAEGTVSYVYVGKRTEGLQVQKIMRITARILGMTTDELFGVALGPGDGYAGSPAVSGGTTNDEA